MWGKIKPTGLNLRGLLLVALVGAWLAGILFSSVFHLSTRVQLIGAGIILIGIILSLQDRRTQRRRLIMLLLFCACLGAWRYTVAQPENDPYSIASAIDSGQLTVRGVVSDEPKVQGRSRLLIVTVNGLSRDGGYRWVEAHGQLEVLLRGSIIEDPYGANYGDTVELRGKLQPPQPHSPTSVFAGMLFPRVQVSRVGDDSPIASLYHLRVTLATLITQTLPQPLAALLIAIVLGLRTPGLAPLNAAFNVTGTAHLIVPSGFKVTILAGLVVSSTRWLYNKPPDAKPIRARYRNWRRWLATVLVVVCIAGYTVLSGAGAAAIRAGVMGILLILAPRISRGYNVYTALAFTAFVMSSIDPLILWDTGFQLSFIGTLGIVLLTPSIQHLLHPLTHLPGGHILVEISAVTLAAQVATLPIFAVTFQQISFVAPLANILTVPLLGIVILLGVLLCATGLVFMPLAILCGWIAWPLLYYMSKIVLWCANLPGAYIHVENVNTGLAWGYYLLLAIVVTTLLWKRSVAIPLAHNQQLTKKTLPLGGITLRIWRIGQVCAALLVIAGTGINILTTRPDAVVSVAFLAVGPAGQPAQGEAILLRTPDGKTLLIDGGFDAPSLAQALDSRLPSWQRSLDAVLLTSPRTDHLLGLQDIVTRYNIATVIDAGILHPTTTYTRWRRTISERNLHYIQVTQGTTIPIGTEVTIQVIWPTTLLHKGSNEVRDNGLIVRIVTPGLRILLLGASAQSSYALAGIIASENDNILQAEIVQIVGEMDKPAPHELQTVLQRAHPSLLVITPAELSPAQHKAGIVSTIVPPMFPTTLMPAEQIVQVAQVGTVEVTSNERGWNVSSQDAIQSG